MSRHITYHKEYVIKSFKGEFNQNEIYITCTLADGKYLNRGELLVDLNGRPSIRQLRYSYDLRMCMFRLSFWAKVKLFRRTLKAVHILHKQGYVHGDIKPENIFIDPGYVLADFGHCYPVRLNTRRRVMGTPGYRAPEMLTHGNWGYKSDIWSLGCIFVELFFGRRVVPRQEQPSMYLSATLDWVARVQNTKLPTPEHNYSYSTLPICDQHTSQLIQSWFSPLPEQRPSIEQLLTYF